MPKRNTGKKPPRQFVKGMPPVKPSDKKPPKGGKKTSKVGRGSY